MEFEKPEPLAGVMLKASSVIFILLIVARLFGYFFNSVLAKSISEVDYGSYAFAWSIAQFSAGIFLLGMSGATARYVAYYRGKKDLTKVNSVIKTGFSIVLFLTFISLLIFLGIDRYFPHLLSLSRNLFVFMCAMFAIHGIGFFFSMIITGYRKPEVTKLLATTFPILSFVFVFVALSIGYGFSAILLGIILAFLISNLLNIGFVLKNYSLKGKFQFGLARDLLAFGIHVAFIDMANGLLLWADIFIIKLFGSFSDLSIYWASTITANIILMFSLPIVSIFSPIVAELFGKGDTKRLSSISSYLFERFFLLSLPILLVLMIFPKGILSTIFTKGYVVGALPLQILSFSMFFLGLSMLFRTLISASGRPQQEARIIFIAAIANVALNLLLVKPYGIVGASFATLLTSLFILILSFVYARKIVEIDVQGSMFMKIIISLTATIGFIYLVKEMFANLLVALIISTLVMGLSYSVFLVLLKALREEDVMLLSMILNKIRVPRKIETFLLDVAKKGIS